MKIILSKTRSFCKNSASAQDCLTVATSMRHGDVSQPDAERAALHMVQCRRSHEPRAGIAYSYALSFFGCRSAVAFAPTNFVASRKRMVQFDWRATPSHTLS